jgi:hypothetical protein
MQGGRNDCVPDHNTYFRIPSNSALKTAPRSLLEYLLFGRDFDLVTLIDYNVKESNRADGRDSMSCFQGWLCRDPFPSRLILFPPTQDSDVKI